MDDDEVAALRARVDKLEHVVGQLTAVLDEYVPRSNWGAGSGRYDKPSRERLDAVIAAIQLPPPSGC